MSAASNRAPHGHIFIDGKPYKLAVNKQGVPVWLSRQFQTQEGDPTRSNRFRWNDWSRGMGDSRGMVRGAVEYAENAFLGAPGRILPGPLVTPITTNHLVTPIDFVEVTAPANRILALGGEKVVEINPATHTVATTQTIAGATLGPSCLFDSQTAIACGDAMAYYIRAAAGTYAQNSISKNARCFGKSGSKLIRGYAHNWSSNDAANITSVNNWSTDYPIGGAEALINQVFAKNRWDYVLKDDGLWTFDEETSEESNTLGDLEEWKSTENRAFAHWHDAIMLCTRAGLYRFLAQAAARTVGIEEVSVNENVLQDAYPTAATSLGHWLYVAYYDGATTYILMCRRAREGDLSMGSPMVTVSVIDTFPGQCRAMKITNLGGTTELYYGRALTVGYIPLTPDGVPASFRVTGSVVVDFPPSDLGEPMTIKQMQSLEIVGRNAAAGRTVQMAASFDDGAFNNVGAIVNALTSTYAKRSWTRGSNDSGRVLQLRTTLANDHATAPIEVRDIIAAYESRPIMVEGAITSVELSDYSSGDVADRRTADDKRTDLDAHFDGALVEVTDPWGETYAARLAAWEGDPQELAYGEEMQQAIAFSIRRLDYGS